MVGGGTGGHIVPVLNIRQALLKTKAKIKVITVGGNSKTDHKFYQGLENHIVLVTGKLHRNITLENIIQLFLLGWGLVSSFLLIKRINPELIFSKAGYVSFPIIFWAKVLRIPYFIHESDIVMGASNRFAANKAKKIFVGFPIKNYPGFSKEKLEYVGQILRDGISSPEKKLFDFGFENNRDIIFVTGGSQGARNINNAIFSILYKLLKNYNVIHHTGGLDYDRAINIRSNLSNSQKQFY